jgi:hypothetical protein
MSQCGSVRVRYCQPIGSKKNAIDILHLYLKNGWGLSSYGHLSLRPLGDVDDHDWTYLRPDQEGELYKILRKKMAAKEDLGLVLSWNNGESGAITTFSPNEPTIGFLLDVDRKTLPEAPRWTDVSWYLPKILNPLLLNKIGVSTVEYYEDN